jgi:hypothetical protein
MTENAQFTQRKKKKKEKKEDFRHLDIDAAEQRHRRT